MTAPTKPGTLGRPVRPAHFPPVPLSNAPAFWRSCTLSSIRNPGASLRQRNFPPIVLTQILVSRRLIVRRRRRSFNRQSPDAPRFRGGDASKRITPQRWLRGRRAALSGRPRSIRAGPADFHLSNGDSLEFGSISRRTKALRGRGGRRRNSVISRRMFANCFCGIATSAI